MAGSPVRPRCRVGDDPVAALLARHALGRATRAALLARHAHSPVVRCHLGLQAERRGEQAAAREQYAACVRLSLDDPVAATGVEVLWALGRLAAFQEEE